MTRSRPALIAARIAARYLEVRRGPRTSIRPLPLELAEAREQLLLAAAHHGGLLGFGVVVVEQVQHAVHDEQRELVVGGDAALDGLAARDRRAHDDVAEQRRRIARVGGRAGPAAALVGLAARRAAARRRSGTRARRSGRSPPRKRR